MHNICLVRSALLYFNMHLSKVFYEQINYYYSFTLTFTQPTYNTRLDDWMRTANINTKSYILLD